jgi:hypothetical protein
MATWIVDGGEERATGTVEYEIRRDPNYPAGFLGFFDGRCYDIFLRIDGGNWYRKANRGTIRRAQAWIKADRKSRLINYQVVYREVNGVTTQPELPDLRTTEEQSFA